MDSYGPKVVHGAPGPLPQAMNRVAEDLLGDGEEDCGEKHTGSHPSRLAISPALVRHVLRCLRQNSSARRIVTGLHSYILRGASQRFHLWSVCESATYCFPSAFLLRP